MRGNNLLASNPAGLTTHHRFSLPHPKFTAPAQVPGRIVRLSPDGEQRGRGQRADDHACDQEQRDGDDEISVVFTHGNVRDARRWGEVRNGDALQAARFSAG